MVSKVFEFDLLKVVEVSSEISKLDSKKSSTGVSIGLLKNNLDI